MTGPAIRTCLAAVLLTSIAAAGGCGVGPGEAVDGEASLTVTRDYGAELLVEGTLEDPTPSDTVVRFLDSNAEIETEYGGNFVSTIDGLEGSTSGGGFEDWFFFVNGFYSDLGAGETKVVPGDRIWWDHRQWSEAYRVPAVVGSWPEPFLHGFGGERLGVVVECVGGGAPIAEACEDAVAALEREGVEVRREDVSTPVEHPDELRVLVGAWSALRSDPAARQLEGGPSASGVYADVNRCGPGYRFDVLGSDARPRLQLLASGLVAAVRSGDDQPTWVVAGTLPDTVDQAASLLSSDALRDRYAVVSGDAGEPLPVPAADELPPATEAPCR